MKERHMTLIRNLIVDLVEKGVSPEILETIIVYSEAVIDLYKEDAHEET